MTFKTIMLASSAALTLTMGATAAWAVSATGTATAEITGAAGTVVANGQLTFGNVTPGPSGSGTIVVDPAGGAPTTTGGVNATGTARGTFDVSTASASTYSVVPQPGGILLTGTVGTTPLSVSNFTFDAPALTPGTPKTATFGIGATLTVPSTSGAGAYSGQYTVDVNFL